MKTALLVSLSLLLASCCYDSAQLTVSTGPSYRNPLLWNRPNLTWAVDYSTVPVGLSGRCGLDGAVQECLRPWESSGVFRFTQATQGVRPDIRIGFRDLGCNNDHAGRAGFPWTADRGQIWLNSQQNWSTGWSLTACQLGDWLPHEVGHSLGLLHTSSCSSCMQEHGPYGKPTHHDLQTLRRVYAPTTVVHPVFGPLVR